MWAWSRFCRGSLIVTHLDRTRRQSQSTPPMTTMADNAALSSLRADALLYVGAIGGVLAASLSIATSIDGLTAMQSVTALTAYLMLGFAAVGGLAAHLPQRRFGAANALTLARGAMITTLAGFLFGPIDTRLSWIA